MENNVVLTVYTDGGARGNPGPAGIGVLIVKNQEQFKISKYIGLATNNQAEYQAVIEALKYLIENFSQSDIVAKFYLDSQLVVEQLSGNYKIKNEGLKPLFNEARDSILKLGGQITFTHIPREQNCVADELVNQAIDANLE